MAWSSQEVSVPRGGSKMHLGRSAGTRAWLGICLYLSHGKQSALGGLGLAEHLGHTLSKLSPRCACRTDSPSASCHAQNVYPICQDNLSSNKLRSSASEQPNFKQYKVTPFFPPSFSCPPLTPILSLCQLFLGFKQTESNYIIFKWVIFLT